MKIINKSKLSRGHLALVIMSIALVTLIVAYVVISLIISSIDNTVTRPPLDIREEIGESSYVGQPLAYDRLKESEILYVYVENENGTFDLTRPDENGEFWLSYLDPNGAKEMIEYIPPVLSAESGFSYEELYAIEEGDGYGRIYMLSYLCSAIGTPYFTARIDLPEGDDEASRERRKELLLEYGFGEGETERVSFEWGKRNEKNEIIERGTHHITIGDTALTGLGRYYIVDDRNCIYYTADSQIDYALMGFHSFVKGMLVAAGIPSDSAYEPILTTDFKHWVNKLYNKEGDVVTEDSHVVLKGSYYMPIKESEYYKPEDYPDGMVIDRNEEFIYKLDSIASDPALARFIDLLVGREVGVRYTDMYATLIEDLATGADMLLDFGDADSLAYSYVITSINSVVMDDVEYHNEGAAVLDGSMITVTYDYYIDGVKQNKIPRHGALALDDGYLADTVLAELTAATVGALATPIEFDYTYTKDNSPSYYNSIVIEDIFKVYDSKGAVVEVAGEKSYVALRYHEVYNGVRSETKSMTVYMKDAKEKRPELYEALIGRGEEKGINVEVYRNYRYYEMIREYTMMEFDYIACFTVPELVASFRYQNGSDRDPFYGESVYENTTGGKHGLYGLNSDVCHEIVKRLGGISDVSASSEGLFGKTIAVGLTHEVKEKYNLYDYTVYFEMPRNIDGLEEGDADFEWSHTLGFTLYVSREDPITGMRYVGSDMYDLVAEVDSSAFEFLNYGFSDLYARENLFLVDSMNIDNIKVEFSMTDVYGEYTFDFDRRYVYMGFYNGVYGVYQNSFEGATKILKYYINVKEGEGSMHTGLSDVLAHYREVLGDPDLDEISAAKIYDMLMGNGEELFLGGGSLEPLGVSYAFDTYEILQNTRYEGTLTEEEQAAAFETDRIMRLEFNLEGDNASAFTYVYDFYRPSDRKIMVALYQADSEGKPASEVVSDFYISPLSFKKIVMGYLTFLSGEEIDCEIAYPDEK